MKNILTTFIMFIVVANATQAQYYKNNYRIGMHLVNLEDGKIALDFYYNQFNRNITKRVDLGLGVGFISYNHFGPEKMLSEKLSRPLPAGVKDTVVVPYYGSMFSSSLLLNINTSYAIIAHEKFRLKLGAGFSVTQYKIAFCDFGDFVALYYTSGGLIYSSYTHTNFEKTYSFAYNFVVEPEWDISSRYFVSARVSPYFFFDNLSPYIYSAGVTMGVRF